MNEELADVADDDDELEWDDMRAEWQRKAKGWQKRLGRKEFADAAKRKADEVYETDADYEIMIDEPKKPELQLIPSEANKKRTEAGTKKWPELEDK